MAKAKTNHKSNRKSKTNRKSRSTYSKLEQQYRKAAKIANEKIKALEMAGLKEFNMQFSRKWDIMLHDKNIKFVNTATGRFLSSPSKKFGKWLSASELRSAIGTLTQFNSSRYTTVEYTREYVEETKAKLGVEDEDLLKSIYKVFREFGFAGRWDSGNVLSDIAEWHDITGRTDMGELLQEFIDDYNDNMTADTPPMDTDMLRGHVSDLVADLYDWE